MSETGCNQPEVVREIVEAASKPDVPIPSDIKWYVNEVDSRDVTETVERNVEYFQKLGRTLDETRDHLLKIERERRRSNIGAGLIVAAQLLEELQKFIEEHTPNDQQGEN